MYNDGLVSAAALIVDPSLKDFTKKFAPVPPKNDSHGKAFYLIWSQRRLQWLAGSFSSIKLPGIASLGDEGKEKAEELTKTILSKSVDLSLSYGGTSDPDNWTDDNQDEFMTYPGQSAGIWDDINTKALEDLFDGSDDFIATLTTLIADGHFITGSSTLGEGESYNEKVANETVTDAFAKALYRYGIPSIWVASGHHPFIIDTQRSCTSDSDGGDDKLATACYRGKLYKLADPDGKSRSCRENAQTGVKCGQHGDTYNHFSTLSGVDQLKDGAWGCHCSRYYYWARPPSITCTHAFANPFAWNRAVNTWGNNSYENVPDSTADPNKNFDSLADMDITVANFINLPVCTETIARRSWTNSDDTESSRIVNYFPCNIDNGKDYCGESTFEDQGSEASPWIEDCENIIDMLTNTDKDWNRSPLEKQRSLVSNGTCHFGVTGKGIHGNVSFMTGAQDIIDIIRDSIKKFGRSDKRVGAKGTMQCDGNIKKQKVNWGLY
ncbi:putative necrosis-inducing factor-domain-containing protein [Aspergillus granulosus]|uniref:Necrosis-inducing factor-domain-containing protein n=1 Tax=Aspergillus granulosus TaxID=176169 RepID=A0ABR4GTS0_9EURO